MYTWETWFDCFDYLTAQVSQKVITREANHSDRFLAHCDCLFDWLACQVEVVRLTGDSLTAKFNSGGRGCLYTRITLNNFI